MNSSLLPYKVTVKQWCR